MLESVRLADLARTRFIEEQGGILTSSDIIIALSLGPYGASLFPAQEFEGFYPPPYGPKAYSASEMNCNSFGNEIKKRWKILLRL
jgi:homocysteine S-methyltransferase